jgi:hypothetical protein
VKKDGESVYCSYEEYEQKSNVLDRQIHSFDENVLQSDVDRTNKPNDVGT